MDEVVLCYSASEYAVGVPTVYELLWKFSGEEYRAIVS